MVVIDKDEVMDFLKSSPSMINHSQRYYGMLTFCLKFGIIYPDDIDELFDIEYRHRKAIMSSIKRFEDEKSGS